MEDESVVHGNNDADVRDNNDADVHCNNDSGVGDNDDVEDDVGNGSVKIECDFIHICQSGIDICE